MTNNISAKELNVGSIFSSLYSFYIPSYQRPYSWTTDHAKQLLDDIVSFAQQEKPFSDLKPYFLGSLLFVKDDLSPSSEVIDGQQRLTTLTILISVLRYLLGEQGNQLTPCIYEKGNKLVGVLEHFRLTVRDIDNEFFRQYIQLENGLSLDVHQLNPLTDSQKRIVENTQALLSELKGYTEQELEHLSSYLLQKCFLVVVTTSDKDSAFRIFSVLNDRGLQLSYADILKAEIIGAIDDTEEQQEYTGKWEELEEQLGVDGLRELFAHIRMIVVKNRAQGSMLDEIRKNVRPAEDPRSFIDDKLVKFGEIYYDILNQSFSSISKSDEINQYLRWLNQISNKDWVPPAIQFIALHTYSPNLILEFLKRLERFAFCLWVIGLYEKHRLIRYSSVLAQLEKVESTEEIAQLTSLDLSEEDKRLVVRRLSGDVYNTKYGSYLLQRLDSELSTGDVTYNYATLSVEHVLPQNPKEGSKWLALFPDREQRDHLVNTIGNLVLLPRKKNSAAGRSEFEVKKEKYFKVNGVTTFALTSQVLSEESWKPSVILKRNQELIDKCKAVWNLSTSDDLQSTDRSDDEVYDPAEADEKSTQERATYHNECIERVAHKLHSKPLVRQATCLFQTADSEIGVVCIVSKRYARSVQFWYAFHRSQRDFLETVHQPYVAFGCGNADTIVLIPFATFLPWLSNMRTTTEPNGDTYWHVDIFEKGSKYFVSQSKGHEQIDVSDYII